MKRAQKRNIPTQIAKNLGILPDIVRLEEILAKDMCFDNY